MADSADSAEIIRLAADIVSAYLQTNPIPAENVPGFIREIRRALAEDMQDPSQSATTARRPLTALTAEAAGGAGFDELPASNVLKPPVPIEESITPEYLVSLEDGKHYRSLRRHLNQKFGLTPDQYRAKWNLPADYPMVAPSYAEQRSRIAHQIGLGRKPSAPADKAASRRR